MISKLIHSTAVLLFTLVHGAFAQPDWVKSLGTSARYSDAYYLTGFGMDKMGKDKNRAESMARAHEHAKANLIQRVRVTIQSTIDSRTEEVGKTLSSYFSSATHSSAALEIQGLSLESYYDEREGISYALAYASRQALHAVYNEKAEQLRKEINGHFEAGRNYEERGERTKALDEFLACFPLFRQLEEAQAILSVVQASRMEALNELDAVVKKDEVSIAEVRKAAQRLIQRPLGSVEDLAWYLAYCLGEQLDARDVPILVTPLTYQDTRMASPFSRYLKHVLESKVREVARWMPVQQVDVSQPRTRDVAREAAQSSGAQYVLRGSYWEQSSDLKFIVTVQRVADGRTVASAEAVLDSAVLKRSGQSLKPENFLKALSDQKQFRTDEVIGGGLSLEVWTNKGSDDLIFTKGERMQVYVRVNLPSYIRLMYHLADGRRTLLVDNYYIDESKVNMVVQIPEEFECDAPYGVEVLQAFARTERFEPIEVVEVEGYKVLKEDLGTFLSTTRGMKKARQGTLQAETRVVMTTMEK